MKDFSYSFSWTQKYDGWTAPQIYGALCVTNELNLLNEIDARVADMTEFPEIEKILEAITK